MMKRGLYIVRQTIYTVCSFFYFLIVAIKMTIIGFFLLTIGGSTPKHKRLYHLILQRQARFIMNHVPGTSFLLKNESNEDFSSPALIISNHQSHIDLMGIIMLAPNIVILTKGWVWNNPLYGAIIRYADFLPITDSQVLVEKLREKVRQGYSIMIFPEGTRSVDCRVQRFHKGAFYIAEQLGLDIVPVFLHNFGKVLPKTSSHLHPGDMRMDVMPRISRDDVLMEQGYRSVTKYMHRFYLNKYEEMCHNR